MISDTSPLGASAESRISHLEAAGASIHRVAAREYTAERLEGASLVVCGSSDEALNARVSRDAQARLIFCNVVDRPALCTWIAPAMIRRGQLQIAVSTGGQSPALAVRIRDAVDQAIGPEYAVLLEMLAALRERVRDHAHSPEARAKIFQAMVWGPAIDLIREGQVEEARSVLEKSIA